MGKADIWVSLAVFAKAPATILSGRFRLDPIGVLRQWVFNG